MIEFRIDRRSGVATYLQLVQQTKRALVLKAYRELEREGLGEARRGLGTFVLRSLASGDAAEQESLRRELDAWMAKARESGLQREDVEALVGSVLDQRFPSSDPAVRE